ncbi:MAG: ATPase, T2SS/T4P/T4SS family [Elusimicrobiota bacterium]
MKETADDIIKRMRPYIEASGAAIEVYFFDADFGVVELLHKPLSNTTEEDLRAIQYSVEQMLLQKGQGVRHVEFLTGPPKPPEAAAEQDVPDVAEDELSTLRAGTGLALDMLQSIDKALRSDAAESLLRERRQAENFLNGPYPQWASEARDRFASILDDAPAKATLRRLRDIYPAVDRTARALARVVEAERAAWGGDDRPPDGAAPCLLQTVTQEDYSDLRRILAEIRPHLGDRTLGDLNFAGTPEDSDEDSRPTNHLLDRIFRDAAQRQIRDVYIEAGEASALLQYRIGREIRPIVEFPRTLYRALLTRIKHLAALDIAERTRQQEGLICFSESSGYKGLNVQVLTIPGQFAERVRLRLQLPREEEKPA